MPPFCSCDSSTETIASITQTVLTDNALVALTLPIAESKPEDKDPMATLVVNLINQDN
jgi:hypothetical protein